MTCLCQLMTGNPNFKKANNGRGNPSRILRSWQHCSCCSHCASFTSLLRPGTCLTSRAFTNSASKAPAPRNLEDQHPVHARRFHRDGDDADRREQVPMLLMGSVLCGCRFTAGTRTQTQQLFDGGTRASCAN
jgi:hypothetical protein